LWSRLSVEFANAYGRHMISVVSMVVTSPVVLGFESMGTYGYLPLKNACGWYGRIYLCIIATLLRFQYFYL